MVVRRCRSGGTGAGRGLLAHGVGGGRCGAAANAGDWVGAVQDGNCWEIGGAAAEFSGDEPAIAGGCLFGYSVVGGNCGAGSASGGADSKDAFGICGDWARGEEIESAPASILRGLA